MTELLLDRARSGDEQAFAELTEPFHRELHVHCYRILGSLQDAEDALQETLLAAWRGLDGYEQRASCVPGCIESPPTAASTACARRIGERRWSLNSVTL